MYCPACKADNQQGPACRRCKADLSLLWGLEMRREALLASARQRLARFLRLSATADDDSLKRTDASPIVADAAAAAGLRAGTDVARLMAIARLLNRDFAGAWHAYLAVNAGTTHEGSDAPSGSPGDPRRLQLVIGE